MFRSKFSPPTQITNLGYQVSLQVPLPLSNPAGLEELYLTVKNNEEFQTEISLQCEHREDHQGKGDFKKDKGKCRWERSTSLLSQKVQVTRLWDFSAWLNQQGPQNSWYLCALYHLIKHSSPSSPCRWHPNVFLARHMLLTSVFRLTFTKLLAYVLMCVLFMCTCTCVHMYAYMGVTG